MIQSFSYMCSDIIYVDFLIYFTKKVGAFEILNLVFISDLNIVFLPEIFYVILGFLDLQIWHVISF